jgi:TonB family protein
VKTNYPDSLTIQQYLEGKLDPEVAHQLEKQALDDPFLWEALEGYSTHRDPAADLSILQRQLHERIVHMQENKKVFDLSWQRLSVAAAAAVMFVSAGILFWMNSHRAPEQLASQSQKPVEVNVIDRDSVEAVISSKEEPVIASLEKKEADLSRTTVSEYKPANPVEKKAIISPKAEEAVAANQEIAPVADLQASTIASASAPAAARQAKAGRLEDGSASLNEVVVSRYNNPPKSGWPAYREYLEVSTKKFKTEPPLSGSVLLFFQVNPDGKLTNIRVVRSLSEAYDKEAVRIVRNGSEWTPPSDGKAYEGRIEVAFQR